MGGSTSGPAAAVRYHPQQLSSAPGPWAAMGLRTTYPRRKWGESRTHAVKDAGGLIGMSRPVASSGRVKARAAETRSQVPGYSGK